MSYILRKEDNGKINHFMTILKKMNMLFVKDTRIVIKKVLY